MKYYKELIEMGCCTRSQLVQITGSDAAASSLIYDYQKKGYIERIRRDLYAAVSIETGQPIPSRFQIASSISADSCVSHHSAFEYYGYANQVYYEVYVTTVSRFSDFTYNGVTYHRVAPHGKIVWENKKEHVHVTSLERTVIDSINDFDKIGGLEETLRCLLLIPTLDQDMLLSSLAEYNNGFLYQKTGYILESFNDSLDLPDSFFLECEKHISNSKKYLTMERSSFLLQKRWKLFAPANLKALTDKGAYYDTI